MDPKAKAYTLNDLIRWLIKQLIVFVRRHPFFSCSLVVHAVVLYLLYSYGTYQLDTKALQQAHIDVAQSVKRAQQVDMEKRIEDMKKIKKLLEQSANKTSSDDTDSKANDDSKSPEELLAEAKKMSQAIKILQQDIKAEDLAKLLNISKEEALKKIEERAKQEQENIKPEAEKAATESVKDMEAEARSTLEQRKKELDAQQQGTKVALENHEQSANTEHADANSGQQGQQGQGVNGEGKNNSYGSNQHGMAAGKAADQNTDPDATKNLREMEEFLTESSYGMKGRQDFFDIGAAHMPRARGNEVKQSGRIIGPGGSFAERFYLNSWYVIGPFQGNSQEALYHNPSYPPEENVDLDAVYFGKDGRILKWQYLNSGEYPFVPPDREEDAVYYGYTEVLFAQAQDLWMWCGADDDMQLWLNQHLIWAGGNIAKQSFFDSIYLDGKHYRSQWNLTEAKRLVHFPQGRNKLLFKLSNGPNRVGIFASIVLTSQ